MLADDSVRGVLLSFELRHAVSALAAHNYDARYRSDRVIRLKLDRATNRQLYRLTYTTYEVTRGLVGGMIEVDPPRKNNDLKQLQSLFITSLPFNYPAHCAE